MIGLPWPLGNLLYIKYDDPQFHFHNMNLIKLGHVRDMKNKN